MQLFIRTALKDINENGLNFTSTMMHQQKHLANTLTIQRYIPILTFKIFIMKDSTLDVIFFAKKKKISKGTELLWKLWQTILGGKGLH